MAVPDRLLCIYLYISPMMTTGDVATIIVSHSEADSGTQRNISPPNVTMAHWPAMMMQSTESMPRRAYRRRNALLREPMAEALKRFHTWSMTNVVKNHVSSRVLMPTALVSALPRSTPRSQ